MAPKLLPASLVEGVREEEASLVSSLPDRRKGGADAGELLSSSMSPIKPCARCARLLLLLAWRALVSSALLRLSDRRIEKRPKLGTRCCERRSITPPSSAKPFAGDVASRAAALALALALALTLALASAADDGVLGELGCEDTGAKSRRIALPPPMPSSPPRARCARSRAWLQVDRRGEASPAEVAPARPCAKP